MYFNYSSIYIFLTRYQKKNCHIKSQHYTAIIISFMSATSQKLSIVINMSTNIHNIIITNTSQSFHFMLPKFGVLLFFSYLFITNVKTTGSGTISQPYIAINKQCHIYNAVTVMYLQNFKWRACCLNMYVEIFVLNYNQIN